MDFFTALRERGIPVQQVDVDYQRNVLTINIEWFRWDQKFNATVEVNYATVIQEPDLALDLIDKHYRYELEKQEAVVTKTGNYLMSTAAKRGGKTFIDTFTRSGRVDPGGWYETGNSTFEWSKTRDQFEEEKKALRHEFEREARELARREAMILEETKRLAQEKEEKDAIASILETAKKRSSEGQQDDAGQ